MRVITGDETGLIKRIGLETCTIERINKDTEQKRANSIDGLCWWNQEKQTSIAIASKEGIVKHWDLEQEKSDWEIPFEGKLAGFGQIPTTDRCVTCNETGQISVHQVEGSAPSDASTFQTRNTNVSKMRIDPHSSGCVATGGKDNLLSLWDVEKQCSIFKAKNVPADNLDMQVPIWVKDMHFVNSSVTSGKTIVTGTAYHHVRLYDTKAKRQPVLSIEYGEYPITQMCLTPDGNRVITCDTTGDVNSFDLRTLKHSGRYVGPAGSVRGIACHQSLPYVAVAGLDRKVHVYNIDSRKRVHSIYLKQRLNCVLFTDEGPTGTKRKLEAEEEAENVSSSDEEDYEGLEINDETDSNGSDEELEE